jgi:integrase/recombinase XerD
MREFDYHLDNFMLYCTSKRLSPKTMRSYEQSLGLFLIYMEQEHGIDKIEKIKTLHIRNYISYLKDRGKYTVTNNVYSLKVNFPHNRNDHKKQISDTTIANYIRNIKVFFSYLSNEHIIQINPAKQVENVKPKRKAKALLSKSDLVLVLNSFDKTTFHGYRNWLITRLILDTGMRITECLTLEPHDIDFKHRSIHLRNTKGGKERYVYFSNKTGNDLQRWFRYRDRYSDSNFLFPTNRGTILSEKNFEGVLRGIGLRFGFDLSPHQLRNNFAKFYLASGGDFATLSRILGHSSVEVTMKAYLDFTDKEVGILYQRHSPLNNLGL